MQVTIRSTLPADGDVTGALTSTSNRNRLTIRHAGRGLAVLRLLRYAESTAWIPTATEFPVNGGERIVYDFDVLDSGEKFHLLNEGGGTLPVGLTAFMKSLTPPAGAIGTSTAALHAPSHLSAGTDPIDLATAALAGLMPAASQALLVSVRAPGLIFAGPVSGADAAPTWRNAAGSDLPLTIRGSSARSGPGAIPVTARTCKMVGVGAGDALTLADGTFTGQRLALVASSGYTAGHTSVVTPAHPVGFATATFSANNQTLDLEWDGAAWFVAGGGGAAALA